MFNIARPEFKFHYVFTQYQINKEQKILSKIQNKLSLLEGIFFDLSKINPTDHYYLLDVNSESYSAPYEEESVSKHAANIYLLSSILELSSYDSKHDPLHSFYSLEKFITSAQFYKNMFFGFKSAYFIKSLETLILDVQRAIDYLESSNLNDVYKELLQMNKRWKKHPEKFSHFIQDLKGTTESLQQVLSLAKD